MATWRVLRDASLNDSRFRILDDLCRLFVETVRSVGAGDSAEGLNGLLLLFLAGILGLQTIQRLMR
jgi:hypothetical protein